MLFHRFFFFFIYYIITFLGLSEKSCTEFCISKVMYITWITFIEQLQYLKYFYTNGLDFIVIYLNYINILELNHCYINQLIFYLNIVF